mmetsp:Transcript_27819/g.32087  ORF Transcript_27819/g.32087 Transcript_27819/m.32087 type:complete len:193 (+) Transcript_27819:218-796(+)
MTHNEHRNCTRHVTVLLLCLCHSATIVTAFVGTHTHTQTQRVEIDLNNRGSIKNIKSTISNLNIDHRSNNQASITNHLSSALFYKNYNDDVDGITQIQPLSINIPIDSISFHSSDLSLENVAMEEISSFPSFVDRPIRSSLKASKWTLTVPQFHVSFETNIGRLAMVLSILIISIEMTTPGASFARDVLGVI